MSRLIETIRVLDGQFYNLGYHQRRVTKTFHELKKSEDPFDIVEALRFKGPKKGLYKCRVIYDTKVEDLAFTPYLIRPIKSLRMVDHDAIEYDYKFENRNTLNELFNRRNKCDDVLIIKGGMVTDATYSNIIFKKKAEWFTPASCLLEGTMRQNLIENGKLRIEQIRAVDIAGFDAFKLINSLLLDNGAEMDVSNIIR